VSSGAFVAGVAVVVVAGTRVVGEDVSGAAVLAEQADATRASAIAHIRSTRGPESG